MTFISSAHLVNTSGIQYKSMTLNDTHEALKTGIVYSLIAKIPLWNLRNTPWLGPIVLYDIFSQ